jgi:hypothetical protein
MVRPKITKEETTNILLRIYSKMDIHVKGVSIIGIRGYYLNKMGKAGANDRNIYDDAFIVISPDHFCAFNGNTDPSEYKDGIGSLIPGMHKYKKGNHGLSRPGGGYPALRPATRGEMLLGRRDGSGTVIEIKAANFHKGGLKTTGSKACQTVYPTQWDEFIELVYSAMDLYKQSTIDYILIEK